MNGHLVIVLALLIAVSYTDLRERRIPNRFLIVATIFHIIFDLSNGPDSRIDYRLPLLISFISMLLVLFLARFRRSLLSLIGMGDLKLLVYLGFFLAPWIDMKDFLLGLGLVSLLVSFASMGRRNLPKRSLVDRFKANLPFAPLLLGASGLAIVI